MSNTEWLDSMLNNKVSKEATIVPQGENREDHMERKVQAFDWIKGVSDLDPVAIEAEYNEKLRQEAKLLGKTAALDDVIADGTTPEEVVSRDFKRDVSSLSDYALAELLAEARGHEKQSTSEMYYELKEKAKAEVAAGRDAAEKALLELIPSSSQLDWQKAFKEFKKNETPAEPKEKDLYKSDVPEKYHDFEHPSEDKFKLPKDPEKALPGNGREADERTDVTAEAGVLKKDIVEGVGKDASLKVVAHCGHCGKEAASYAAAAPKFQNEQEEALWHFLDAHPEFLLEMVWDRLSPEEKASMSQSLQTEEAEASQKEAVTPPGAEHAVKELKKNPEVDNPWAVAWYMKNKGDKFKKGGYDQPRSEVYPKTAELCPLCGGAGEDLKNGQMEHMACKTCNLTYGSAEITSHASKADVIAKVAELQKTAEVASPWVVTKDEQGNEVIARVEAETTNTKESEEDKKDEIQK